MKLSTVVLSMGFSLACAGCVTVGGFETGPESEEEAVRANLELGVEYIQAGRPEAAIPALQRALEFDERNVDVHRSIAVAYDQVEDLDNADMHHRRAVQLAPNNADVRNGYAVFLCRQNRWSDAQAHFDRAIAGTVDEARVAIMLNAGTCARRGGALTVAEQYFRSALDADPVNADALRSMLDLSVRTENFISARGFFQRLQGQGVAGPADLYFCVIIEQELRNAEAAGECGTALAREFPGSQELQQLRLLQSNGG